jgi:hypothetical protein
MLCPDRKLLVLFPITLWFGGFGMLTRLMRIWTRFDAYETACLISLIGVAIHNGSSSAWTIGVYDSPTTLHLSMITAALSAATNFFSTFLISWKAWCVMLCCFGFQLIAHQFLTRQRRALFHTQTSSTAGPGTRAGKIMALLIESGFIYFGLWVLINESTYPMNNFLPPPGHCHAQLLSRLEGPRAAGRASRLIRYDHCA